MRVSESLLREPCGAVLAVADRVLQRRERGCARLEIGELPAGALRSFALDALALLQCLDPVAQHVEAGFAGRELGFFLAQLFLDVDHLTGDAGREGPQLGVEAFAPLLVLREHAGDALPSRLDHANRLLDLRDPFLRVGCKARRLCDGGLERRECAGGACFLGSGRFAGGERRFKRPLGSRLVSGERGFLLCERFDLRIDLRDLAGDPCFRFARECELLLQPRHFGIGRIEAALLLVQRVTRRIVLGAQSLLPRLGRTHFGLDALERGDLSRHRARMALARVVGVLLLGEPEEVLDFPEARLVLLVLGRDLGLRFELRELRAELDPDVLDPREILARVGDPAFGLLASLLVFRDAGGLFEEDAQLLRLRLDHTRNHALLDDRVRAGPEARAEEQIVDVAPAHGDVVDVVRRVAVARQDALDRQFGVLAPLSADAPAAVVEGKLDGGAADRLAVAGAVEDHVLHGLAAQRGGLRLAQHPAHGIDDIGLAAAVRPDDADELPGRADRGRIDERLESR